MKGDVTYRRNEFGELVRVIDHGTYQVEVIGEDPARRDERLALLDAASDARAAEEREHAREQLSANGAAFIGHHGRAKQVWTMDAFCDVQRRQRGRRKQR